MTTGDAVTTGDHGTTGDAVTTGDAMTTGDVTGRRLIGWRVRWQYRVYAEGQWRPDHTHLIALPIARDRARYLRGDGRTRNVRVMRVYRRRRPT